MPSAGLLRETLSGDSFRGTLTGVVLKHRPAKFVIPLGTRTPPLRRFSRFRYCLPNFAARPLRSTEGPTMSLFSPGVYEHFVTDPQKTWRLSPRPCFQTAFDGPRAGSTAEYQQLHLQQSDLAGPSVSIYSLPARPGSARGGCPDKFAGDPARCLATPSLGGPI